MSNLEDDPLVYGELGDDVGEEEVAVVARGRVHADLEEEAGPRVRHQPPQLVALLLVGGVVDVRRAQVHQQAAELQEQDAHGVGGAEGVVGVDDVVDEGGDDVLGVVLVGRRRAADQRVALASVEANGRNI